ncbi:MAG TPA: alkaline phosphatase PhoX [Candidatus Sericytochromatia bacterium]|jgi:secreted PhoX family phosphatase
MALSRRQFFTLAGAGTATAVLASPLKALYARPARGRLVRGGGYGNLIVDPNGLLDLPKGFQYRAFSRTGDTMSDGNPVPADHDGMAAFPGANNTVILVRNHELSPTETNKPGLIAPTNKQYDSNNRGGTTTLIVGPNRELISHYASLAGTNRNCAGGPTPWGSWITCEETTETPATTPINLKPHGYNFEVPANASGPVDPIPLIAMGRFNHEAVAVDPKTGIVYQTEDRGDSLFYRFIPNQRGNLKAGGVLQALVIKGKPQVNTSNKPTKTIPVGEPLEVEWVTIDNPNPDNDNAPTGVRYQGYAKGAAQFTRGEGAWYGNGEVYFTCTNGGAAGAGQVWRYVPGTTAQQGGTIELFVEPDDPYILDAPDNVVVAPTGDLFLCEDGPNTQYVVGVNPGGQLYQFARNALNDSEFAGACFSPSGQTMFVNIQTPGITFAIWGPWRLQRR